MFCKFCGTDIGELTSCPICNDGKNLPAKEKIEENGAQSTSSAQNNLQNPNLASTSEGIENISKRAKILGAIRPFIKTTLMLLGMVIIFIDFFKNIDTYAAMEFESMFLIKILPDVTLVFAISCFLESVYDMIVKLVLRSYVNRYNPSNAELFHKLPVKDGVYQMPGSITVRYLWDCLGFKNSKKVSTLNIVSRVINMVFIALIGTFAFLYTTGIGLKCQLAGGLPETGKVMFFITPLGIITVLLLIALLIVAILLETKISKGFHEIRDNYFINQIRQ